MEFTSIAATVKPLALKWCILFKLVLLGKITFFSISFLFQVAGPYLPQYDVYYKKLDVDGKGEIGAMEAATFLKKSGLSDEMLGKVQLE